LELSTRSYIEFKQNSSRIQIYQHSDGYPSSTIPEIERFLKWNGIRNGDLSYTVANFVTFCKLETIVHFIKGATKDKVGNSWRKEYRKPFPKLFEESESNMSMFHTGYGIQPELLTDREILESGAEYFYIVDLPTCDTFDNENYNVQILAYDAHGKRLDFIGSTWYSNETKKIKDTSEKLEKAILN